MIVCSPNCSVIRTSVTRMGMICLLMPAASAADSVRHSDLASGEFMYGVESTAMSRADPAKDSSASSSTLAATPSISASPGSPPG